MYVVCLGLESRPRLDYSNIGKQDVCPALPFPIISPAFLESTGIDTTSYPQLGLTEAQRWCNHGLHGHTELVILSIRTFQPPLNSWPAAGQASAKSPQHLIEDAFAIVWLARNDTVLHGALLCGVLKLNLHISLALDVFDVHTVLTQKHVTLQALADP